MFEFQIAFRGQNESKKIGKQSLKALSRLEYLNSALNLIEQRVEIITLRIVNLQSCHTKLRQIDSIELANVTKNIILDISTNAALEILLKKARNVSGRNFTAMSLAFSTD
ncbi:hypothetical protein HELRODRAFT_170257 [Helobdella robusta]|uniref:Uncharacterized protein n=1 Tax=Helobdella robusta TaxID=6412 RepID=T1F2U5_HELRO|nr:hypothetical protein HELRODRAFT_170257 [Helobdella robusta]ESO07716.1 hypothetical protein HELRODRAFT_170257 [Helobdella robusta]